MPTLHVYLDESGDYEFKPNRSLYIVFAALWTYDPKPIASKLTDLRFSLLKEGKNLDSFHAHDDHQANRTAVLNAMCSCEGWNYAAAVVKKPKVERRRHALHKFYPRFSIHPLRHILRQHTRERSGPAMIFLDRLPESAPSKHQHAAIKAVKVACVYNLPPRTQFLLYCHDRRSNALLQAVDYCAWAVFRKWERGDYWAYNLLRPRLAYNEIDVMSIGRTTYYLHPSDP